MRALLIAEEIGYTHGFPFARWARAIFVLARWFWTPTFAGRY